MTHDYNDLIRLFNDLFRDTETTVLVAGKDEPLYLPRDGSCPWDRVIFAHGFFASALHEISHWCIAGRERRKKVDFGYWYQPDGRTAEQQRRFEQVEVKPQALEWIFSVSARSRFNLSLDNLSGSDSGDIEQFRTHLREQVRRFLSLGLPPRAALFQQALVDLFRPGMPVHLDEFRLTAPS